MRSAGAGAEFSVDAAIGRHPDRALLRTVDPADGKPSSTRFLVSPSGRSGGGGGGGGGGARTARRGDETGSPVLERGPGYCRVVSLYEGECVVSSPPGSRPRHVPAWMRGRDSFLMQQPA